MVDPLKTKDLLVMMTESSRKQYLSTWVEFVSFAKINVSKPPTKDDFFNFLKKRKNEGSCGKTLWKLYSFLNKVYTELYEERLQVNQGASVFFCICQI